MKCKEKQFDYFIENQKNPKIVKELKQYLEQASEEYYNTENKILSDKDFDILKDIYESFGTLLDVGAAPTSKGVDVAHEYGILVGTLFKANLVYKDENSDKLSIEEWFNNIDKNIDTLEVSRKYDGNSVTLSYKNGKCVQALTRGRDGKGKDLTKMFKDRTIKCQEEVGIKYEVVVSYKNFDKINEELILGRTYANPRSVLGGILKDSMDAGYKYLDLIPLMAKFKKDSTTSRENQIKFMKEEFGEKSEFFKGYNLIDTIIQDPIDTINSIYIDYIKNIRNELPYMIDGLVIQVVSPQETIEELGIISGRPRYAIALKFPYLEEQSEVTDIEFDIGNTGKFA